MLHRGQEIKVEITDIDPEGRGVGQIDGKKILIYYTVPGDIVKARIVRIKRREVIGQLLDVISESEWRVKPRCKHFGLCGGCKLQNYDYVRQLAFKRRIVKQAFQRHGINAEVDKVYESKNLWFYRNRMDYVIGLHLEVGLRPPEKWFEVVDLDECYLLSPESNEILKTFKKAIREGKYEAFNTKTQSGFLRYLVIREGKFTSERMVNIVTFTGQFQGIDQLMNRIIKLGVTSFYWSINPKITDVSYGEELKNLYGTKYLREKILGYVFNIHPNSFFQTNSYQACQLVKFAQTLFNFRTSDKLLDLYCGTGLFAISLHGYVNEVVGLEIDSYAVECAKLNAIENDVKNINFIEGDAAKLSEFIKDVNLVVVDPPRPGMHPKTIKAILDLKPREIIYFSCNPETMARDISLLSKRYQIEGKVHPIDMFPHTPHVEAVVKLVRR